MRRTLSFTEQDILRNCGRGNFEAGTSDARSGRVLDIEFDGDDSIEGDVAGRTGRMLYSASITLEKDDAGVFISGDCSCQEGYNCRHVAAVLLGALNGFALRPPPPPPTPEQRAARLLKLQEPASSDTLTPDLQSWIARLDQVRRTGGEDFPPEIDRRLLYVLVALPGRGGTAPRLGVAPMQARILKSGALSAKPRPVEPQSIAYTSNPAQYLRPSDLRILRALHGRMRETHADMPPAYSLLDQAGAGILEQILATGRARFETVLGPALAPGPPRPGHLVWVEGEETLAPHPRLDGEDGVLALAAHPPVYLDPEAGLAGPIALDLPPHIAAALVDSPPLPAASARALNAALAQRVPGLALRLPEPPQETIVDKAPVPVLRLTQIEVPPSPYYYGKPLPPEALRLAALSFRYGPVTVPFGDLRARPTRLSGGRLSVVERDVRAEQQAVAQLLAHGLSPVQERRPNLGPNLGPRHARDFVPDGGEEAWTAIQAVALPALKAGGSRS